VSYLNPSGESGGFLRGVCHAEEKENLADRNVVAAGRGRAGGWGLLFACVAAR